MTALRQVDLGPGRSFLDVAAGSGALSILAAHTGADVTAVDASPTMIDRLEERAHSEGLDIETHVVDGTYVDFDDDRFDVVSSVHKSTFPDAITALTEMIRVARPGGQVQMVALGAKSDFRDFLEGGGLSEVRVISERVAREGVLTQVDIGIGVKR